MEWISVSDRLPKDGEFVLTYKNGTSMCRCTKRIEMGGFKVIGFGQWQL